MVHTKIKLERDELDGGWAASDPSMPGAVAQGETKREAVANLQEVVQDILRRPAPSLDADHG